MATRSAESPLPVLIVIILAAMSLIQLIAPDLLHPGLTLFLIGIVFLVLHFINWLKDATTLVTGWILAGFGLGFWATTFEVFWRDRSGERGCGAMSSHSFRRRSPSGT
jgi:hypothetical protein